MSAVKNRKAKRFYKKDQKGIYNRYVREFINWRHHLDNTKAFVLKYAKEQNIKNIAFLGSGWLLDIPVKELLELNVQIDFYDIVHPKQIQYKYKDTRAVTFVGKDLTGGLIDKLKVCKDFKSIEQMVRDVKPSLNSNYDMVVSLNILNQLDVLFCDFVEKQFNSNETELKILRREIQKKHLDLIQTYNALLITDYEELMVSKDMGTVFEKYNLIYTDIPNNESMVEWEWLFDMHGEYRSKYNTIFKVKAVKL